MTDQEKLNTLVASISDDLKETVDRIEAADGMLTQNNYGDYMNLLIVLGDGSGDKTKLIALALVEAGANTQGVASALRLVS